MAWTWRSRSAKSMRNGHDSADALEQIKSRAKFSVARINEIEKTTTTTYLRSPLTWPNQSEKPRGLSITV